jgi:hypothetical protein
MAKKKKKKTAKRKKPKKSKSKKDVVFGAPSADVMGAPMARWKSILIGIVLAIVGTGMLVFVLWQLEKVTKPYREAQLEKENE